MSYENVQALLRLRDSSVRAHHWLALGLLVQNLLGCKVYDDTFSTTAYATSTHPCVDGGCEGNRGEPDAPRVVSGLDGARNLSDDACPTDDRKSEPGACGCGKTEEDADEDGTPDCVDACPKDDSKTAPGVCGCGTSEDDSDDDGTPDCLDGCPHDPDRTTEGRGTCACGQADPEDAGIDGIECVKSTLRHRYSFNGDATLSRDSVGMADAKLFHTGQTGRSVRFGGDHGRGYRDESYAALPSHVWNASTSITLEAWIAWEPSGNAERDQWQRVIDVARSDEARNYYFYLTPLGRGGISAGIRLGGREANINAPMPAPKGTPVQLACVLDKRANTLALYVEGALQGTTQLPAPLETLDPDEIWLGRSHFADDPELSGELFELRVWGTALNEEQLKTSAAQGPNQTH